MNECVICYDNILDDKSVKVTSCSHIFHNECLNEWLQKHDTCPICRNTLHIDNESMSFVITQKNQNQNLNNPEITIELTDFHEDIILENKCLWPSPASFNCRNTILWIYFILMTGSVAITYFFWPLLYPFLYYIVGIFIPLTIFAVIHSIFLLCNFECANCRCRRRF